MSIPTIIVEPTLSTSISNILQIATPFSYTFSNSDIAPPGVINDAPVYSGGNAVITSQATSNTIVLVTPSNTYGIPNNNPLTGLVYSTDDLNISNASVFEFTLPDRMGSATIGFLFGLSATLSTSGISGQNTITIGGTSYSYGTVASLRHTYSESGNSFNVELLRSGQDNVTIQSAWTVPVQGVQFTLTNPSWAFLLYPQWISDLQYAIGFKVRYNGVNYISLQGFNGNNVPSSSPLFWGPTDPPPDLYTPTFTITAPIRDTHYPSGFPLLTPASTTSSSLLQFLQGSGTSILTLSSLTGFQSSFASQILRVNQTIRGGIIATTLYTFTIEGVLITVEPTLTSPISISTYQPFGPYIYSIPETLVNVILQSNTTVTSSNLLPLIAQDGTFAMTFNSDIGLTTGGTSTIRIDALLNGNTVISSNVTIFNTTATTISVFPSIPTGSLSLYRYEPFSYAFTISSLDSVGLSLRFTRSSSELQTYMALSQDLQSVTFQGTFVTSYTAILNLIVDLMFGETVIETTTILVSVGTGRFFPPSPNQNFQLYQYEDVSNTFGSNIDFLSQLSLTSVVSAPSLPSGLTFGGSGNAWYMQGIPILQVNQSNYQIIGSNSSNGRIVRNTISIKVNEQQVRITPSAYTLSGLIVDASIIPITLTALQPPTIYYSSFNYTWSSLPSGFSFQDVNGNTVSQPFTPPISDTALTISLVGAPSLAFATTMSTYSSNLYQTQLVGTRTDQTGKQITGRSLLNFSMGDTVLIDVSNSVSLYQSKPLSVTDFLITARSFFSSATISSVTADSLPPGLSLVVYSSPNIYRLSGTPTTVNLTGSYTFTGTNTNGISRSVTVTIPINPDVVAFGGSTPASGTVFQFIVSRELTNAKTGYYTTPIVFTATSTAAPNTIVYSSSINFEDYGLIFNTSTGTLTGTPTIPLASTSVTITATDNLLVSASRTIQVTILADVFTWPTYSPTYFQNKVISLFQFVMVSTLSDRPIQSFSSIDLPTGLFINAAGILSGTPSVFPVGGVGNFTIIASTGFSTASQVYTYSMYADQLLIIQTNEKDTIETVFSDIEYRAIQYSSDSFVNASFSIGSLSPATSATISVTTGGLLSGDFTTASLNTTYSATLTAVYQTVTATTVINILFSSSGIGTIRIPTELSTLTFSEPTQPEFTFFEYVPYSITIRAIGSANFIYYFTSAIPLGFQLTKSSSGVTATLSGISPTLANQGITVYAKIDGGYAVSKSIGFRTITPFFINPQMGAGAYTAILRNDVEGNAAQNARDNRRFPQVDPLAGPLMAPRAPDVFTPNDCILKLCKKPCPTCHTMM